jgi:hypothetical protein
MEPFLLENFPEPHGGLGRLVDGPYALVGCVERHSATGRKRASPVVALRTLTRHDGLGVQPKNVTWTHARAA